MLETTQPTPEPTFAELPIETTVQPENYPKTELPDDNFSDFKTYMAILETVNSELEAGVRNGEILPTNFMEALQRAQANIAAGGTALISELSTYKLSQDQLAELDKWEDLVLSLKEKISEIKESDLGEPTEPMLIKEQLDGIRLVLINIRKANGNTFSTAAG